MQRSAVHHLGLFFTIAGLMAIACSPNIENLFYEPVAGGVAGSGGAGVGGEGGVLVVSASSADSSSASTGGPICGDGQCDASNETCTNCSQDCGACQTCGDGQCNGADTCTNCPQDCGACPTCGDGQCDAPNETCTNCSQDCGNCPQGPTCPHSVCFASVPLDPMDCFDPCVTQVCAATPSCCMGSPPMWDAACTAQAQMLCGADACVTAVCQQDPTCCTTNWTQACVGLAVMLCNTTCMCAHSICAGGQALASNCNPCAAAVCQADPYCCMNGWDNICIGEVESICGIICN